MQTTSAPKQASFAGETGCCPRFAPESWHDRQFTWHDKLFVKDHVHSLFHFPLNMEKMFERERALIEAAEAQAEEPIVLSNESSPWGADYYFAVSKEVPRADMTTLSGTFLTRVFEGPYRDIPRWVEEMRQVVAARGKKLENLYFWYTTCPRCARAYNANYVVLFAKIA